MLRTDPFFIDRSIRRAQPPGLKRALRYAEGAARFLTGTSARPADPSRLTVLEECRSYHLGWILKPGPAEATRGWRPGPDGGPMSTPAGHPGSIIQTTSRSSIVANRSPRAVTAAHSAGE